MLFTCLLSKDGIAYTFDLLKEKVNTSSMVNDIEMEDSREEEGSPEDWWNHTIPLTLVPQLEIPNLHKTSFPERNESKLNVLLELVIPPPRMA